ncbi:MAG: ABC transporter substrate-binding protein [Actinomycetota bacterium]
MGNMRQELEALAAGITRSRFLTKLLACCIAALLVASVLVVSRGKQERPQAHRAAVSVESASTEISSSLAPTGSPGAQETTLTVGGTGGKATSRPGSRATGTGSGSTKLTATDRGVTKDSVLVAVIVPSGANFSYGSTLGIPVASYPMSDFVAPFVKEVNATGGISGRKLEVAMVEFNLLSRDDWQAACVKAAEDLKAFAVLTTGGYEGNEGEGCLADKQLPTITFNLSSEDMLHRREKGWIRQILMNVDRTVKNWVDWAIQSGIASSSKRMGVWWQAAADDDLLVNNVLLPYMKSRGLNVVATFGFSNDTSQWPVEASSAVLRFKSSKVDLVWPAGNWFQNTFFTRQAESQDYHPRYTASDFGFVTTESMSQMYDANQWDRVRAVTVFRTGEQAAGKDPTPEQKQCQEAYQRYGGKPPQNMMDSEALFLACEQVWLLAKAARLVGPDLTRARFLAAIDSLGTYNERVAMSDPLTFRKGKYDGADRYAVIEWRKECKCYHQVEGFRSGKW